MTGIAWMIRQPDTSASLPQCAGQAELKAFCGKETPHEESFLEAFLPHDLPHLYPTNGLS
jgi:hypothetical protein